MKITQLVAGRSQLEKRAKRKAVFSSFVSRQSRGRLLDVKGIQTSGPFDWKPSGPGWPKPSNWPPYEEGGPIHLQAGQTEICSFAITPLPSFG